MIGHGAIIAVMVLGVGATALPRLDNHPPRLVWNASASVPIGLYIVDTIIATARFLSGRAAASSQRATSS